MNKGTVYNIMILSCGLGRVSNTNQTSSPSPSSDLFEDNNENTQLQENVENNNTDIDQQDETTTELQGSNDNNTIFG
jgi:hypothetical protein